MANVKKSIAGAELLPTFEPRSKARSVRLASGVMLEGMQPSPARDLQANLAAVFGSQGAASMSALYEPVVEKLPLKWTLLGASVLCGAFWVVIGQLIFK